MEIIYTTNGFREINEIETLKLGNSSSCRSTKSGQKHNTLNNIIIPKILKVYEIYNNLENYENLLDEYISDIILNQYKNLTRENINKFIINKYKNLTYLNIINYILNDLVHKSLIHSNKSSAFYYVKKIAKPDGSIHNLVPMALHLGFLYKLQLVNKTIGLLNLPSEAMKANNQIIIFLQQHIVIISKHIVIISGAGLMMNYKNPIAIKIANAMDCGNLIEIAELITKNMNYDNLISLYMNYANPIAAEKFITNLIGENIVKLFDCYFIMNKINNFAIKPFIVKPSARYIAKSLFSASSKLELCLNKGVYNVSLYPVSKVSKLMFMASSEFVTMFDSKIISSLCGQDKYTIYDFTLKYSMVIIMDLIKETIKQYQKLQMQEKDELELKLSPQPTQQVLALQDKSKVSEKPNNTMITTTPMYSQRLITSEKVQLNLASKSKQPTPTVDSSHEGKASVKPSKALVKVKPSKALVKVKPSKALVKVKPSKTMTHSYENKLAIKMNSFGQDLNFYNCLSQNIKVR